MIKYATYNRFAHLFMQFLKNVASTAGSSVSLTLGYKIAARATFEKVLRHNFDLIVSKSQKRLYVWKLNTPGRSNRSQNTEKSLLGNSGQQKAKRCFTRYR